jgi:type IV pilus assembly protein PilQ
MKTNWGPSGLAWLALAILVWSCGPLAAAPGPAAPVLQVSAAVKDQAVRLEVHSSGPFQYTSYRPSQNLFVVDLTGVAPGASDIAQVLQSDVVSSYRVLQFSTGDQSSVRLEVLLRTAVEPQIERQNPQLLVLTFAQSRTRAAAPASAVRQDSRPPESSPVAPASSTAAARPASAIEHVELSRAGQQPEVIVAGNGRLVYHTLRLGNPERLVLDFSGARMAVSKTSIAGNEHPVRGIRVGQYRADTARVVIELAQAAPYNVHADGNSLSVVFGTAAGNSPDASAIRREVTKAVPHAFPPPAAPAVQQTSAREAIPLPVTLTEPAAALASPKLAAREEAASAPPPQPTAPPQVVSASAPVSPQPAPAPAATQPSANGAVTGSAASVQAPAKSAGKFSGEPISVNFKDLDLKDFFRLIHEISGLNVVVDPNVKGNLTLVLDEVPWDQALDIVLRNNNLDEQLEGNVLRIATKDTLKREAEQRRDLAKAEAEAADTVTTTRVLSYSKATDVRDTLKRFLSSRGDILADSRSNTLIIRDIPAVLPVLDNLIRQLDRKSQQVEIEARVVVATRAFAREIGTQFGFAVAGATGNSHNVIGGVGLVGNSPIVRDAAAFLTGNPPPPLVSLPGTATTAIPGIAGDPIPLSSNFGVQSPTSGVTFAHTEPNLALDFIITAAETKGVGRLLSKPKVITQNNQKATVKQGTKIPVQTIINNTISVQFIDAVLKLEVTPQITAEGTVMMDVVVENTQIDPAIPRVEGIPALDTQSAETSVLVSDGGTVVIGGIIISSQRTDVSQVPLFGSIPLIGHLFKHTAVNTQAQELLFFLTPRILPT